MHQVGETGGCFLDELKGNGVKICFLPRNNIGTDRKFLMWIKNHLHHKMIANTKYTTSEAMDSMLRQIQVVRVIHVSIEWR